MEGWTPSQRARELSSKRLLGKNAELSIRWIEDRTKIVQSEKKHLNTRYNAWMLGVKRRDNWKCKINNSACEGRLEAHHILNWIDYPELKYELNNGITLCHAHHPKGRKQEAKLSPYLQSLVAEGK